MAAPPDARKQRLTSELADAELALDALRRTLDPGKMRSQQAICGQEVKVFGLRAELVAISMKSSIGETRAAHRSEWNELQLRIKDANAAARAASRQASDDELPELLERLREASALEGELANLHH